MISIDMHSRANLTPVPDFEKFKFFFKKNKIFKTKKEISYFLEKFYYLIYILRQIRYNLV